MYPALSTPSPSNVGRPCRLESLACHVDVPPKSLYPDSDRSSATSSTVIIPCINNMSTKVTSAAGLPAFWPTVIPVPFYFFPLSWQSRYRPPCLSAFSGPSPNRCSSRTYCCCLPDWFVFLVYYRKTRLTHPPKPNHIILDR